MTRGERALENGGARVLVRPPRWASTLITAWCVFLISISGIPAFVKGEIGGGVFLTVIWLPFLLLSIVGARSYLAITGSVLTETYVLRTKQWEREAIEGFRVGRLGLQPFMDCVYLVTAASVVPLMLTWRYRTRQSRANLARWCDELNQWLREPPPA